jgi:hypothetical protein
VPVAKTEPGRALAAAAVVVLGAVLLVLVVLFLNSRASTSGDGQFVLSAQDLFDRQQQDSVPTCFNDPVNGNRPICVFHTGGDVDEGWVGYDAQVDGCAFETLAPGAEQLVVACTGETFPFTGEGLRQYDVTVDDDGRLVIDLDGPDETTTTTVAESGEVPGG